MLVARQGSLGWQVPRVSLDLVVLTETEDIKETEGTTDNAENPGPQATLERGAHGVGPAPRERRWVPDMRLAQSTRRNGMGMGTGKGPRIMTALQER